MLRRENILQNGKEGESIQARDSSDRTLWFEVGRSILPCQSAAIITSTELRIAYLREKYWRYWKCCIGASHSHSNSETPWRIAWRRNHLLCLRLNTGLGLSILSSVQFNVLRVVLSGD